MAMRDVLDHSLGELEAWCVTRRWPAYRGRQIAAWLFRRGVRDFAAMTNVAAPVRRALAEEFHVGTLALADVARAADGTRKLLFRLADGAVIESVLIPDGGRLTLCVSTQAGCAMGCAFCATARLGLGRHLSRGEIVAQFLEVRALVAAETDPASDGPGRITNMVFMGMGEPLHNYERTVGAIDTLTAAWGADFSARRLTVSTVGLIPEMQRLLTETQVNLAVSLTAVDQELRARLMPVSRRYPVAELLAACRALPVPRRKRITFEYVMLARVNDRETDARALVRALAGIRCKVNLIPFNPFPGAAYTSTDPVTVRRFQDQLLRAGVHASVRASRGADVAAACGQLAAHA